MLCQCCCLCFKGGSRCCCLCFKGGSRCCCPCFGGGSPCSCPCFGGGSPCSCPCFGGGNQYTGCWKFRLTIISAKDLPNVRKTFPTRAYAKIYVGWDGETTKHRTDSDNNNGLNPSWNHSIAYRTAESGVLYNGMTVTIKLYTKRSFGCDRYIGEVRKTMKELFEGRSQDGSGTLSLPIFQGSVKTLGILDISYSFEKMPDVLRSHFERRGRRRGSAASFTKSVLSEAVFFAVLAQDIVSISANL